MGAGQPPNSARGREMLNTLPESEGPHVLPRLELIAESMGGHAVPCVGFTEGDAFRIGSHQANHLVIDDPLVSQFHCKLRVVQGEWHIEDLGSLNGTRVDGVRIRDAHLPLPSCKVQVGNSLIRVFTVGQQRDSDEPTAPSFGSLHARSPVMRRLFGLLERIAPTHAPVLLQGESGTGKEVIASEIVKQGPRRDGRFIVVDGGTLSPSLAESELFGHARGAFTGADADRMGAFEAANGGTLFLDEIGELPLELQPKLLRALESREIKRVGETRMRKVDVRVIAATNRTLEAEVNQRRFREDLYFRLSVVTVVVPPLRDRLEDIPDLVDSFVSAMGLGDAKSLFTPAVLADLANHQWPGNVRELRNYVERALVLQKADPTKSGTYPAMGPARAVDINVPFRQAKEVAIEAFDREYLQAMLDWSGGNVTQAARRAGMDRVHLHRLLSRYRIQARANPELPHAGPISTGGRNDKH